MNAFALNWKEFHGYAFPPFSLISRCLAKVKREQADLVLLCPLWQSQPCFPLLLEMSTDIPRIFHENPFILHSHLLEPHPLLKSSRFQLSAWKLSGNDFKTSVFFSEVIQLLLGSARQSTIASYQSAWKHWMDWCTERDSNPLSPNLTSVMNYLTSLFNLLRGLIILMVK